MSEEYDPAFECYRIWLHGDESDSGGAADDDGGDYAAEEEARINNELETWNHRKTNKESVPTTTPESGTRNMKAQEEGGELTPRSITKKEVVYKDTEPDTTNPVVSQNNETNEELVQKTKQGNVTTNQLSHPMLIADSLSLSLLGQLSITNYDSWLTKNQSSKDSLSAIIGLYDSLKPKIKLVKAIEEIREGKKEIEATICFICFKKGICYLNMVHNLFPLLYIQTVKNRFTNLAHKGIIEVKDKNNGFETQATIYEHAILRNCNNARNWIDKIKYYGLTQDAVLIMPLLVKDIETVIPAPVIKQIKERYMSTLLGHTKQEHKVVSRNRQKKEIEALITQFNILYQKHDISSTRVEHRLDKKYPPVAHDVLGPVEYQKERLEMLKILIAEDEAKYVAAMQKYSNENKEVKK